MKGISVLAKLAFLAWMAAMVILFFLVSLSPYVPIAALMPDFVLELSKIARSFFYDQSSLH
jgi:hypothetical protein